MFCIDNIDLGIKAEFAEVQVSRRLEIKGVFVQLMPLLTYKFWIISLIAPNCVTIFFGGNYAIGQKENMENICYHFCAIFIFFNLLFY